MFKECLLTVSIAASFFNSSAARADDIDTALVLESVDGSGPVEVLHAGVWSPVQVGTTVDPGDSVRTGNSSARLVYDDGSAVALSTATEIQVQSDPSRVIELEKGTVWGKIEKTAATPLSSASPSAVSAMSNTASPVPPSPYKFILRSRTIIMGVRGTEFLVESGAGGEVAVNTLEGTVDTAPDLATLHSGRGVSVRRFERIRARMGAAFGKAEGFKGEELTARLGREHGGLARFLSRPIRRLRPDRSARQQKREARQAKKAERLRRKAVIQANPNGSLQPGQGRFGTPSRRHRSKNQ